MLSFFLAALAEPIIRAEIENIAIKLFAELLHRRSTDPDFLAKSDAVFPQLLAAKTPEELTNAQNALRTLMSSS